jgi:serine/threonine protein kinase
MVANRYLTEYQSTLLARGHADSFFLNEYKILDRLGKGRMAGVYKAQHRLGQVVAIKVLPPSKAKEPTLLGRFQREAKLALLLRHPNIVRTFQTGLAGNLHYLVMEYIEGETLEDVMTRRKQMPARGRAPHLSGAPGLAAHPRAGPGPPRPQALEPDADPAAAG